MVQIAYLLLCHKDADAVIAQARRLVAAGDRVAIHLDGRAPAAAHDAIRAALDGEPGVTFAARRHRCGWGEWSLVAATLEAARAALAAFPGATHFYLLSGDCMPIKSADYAHEVLAAQDADHIEAVPYFDSGWIRTGFVEERLVYRHPFNERRQRRLFYASLALQRRLGLKRRIPEELDMMIGSQWWCLRRATLEAVLAFSGERRDVVRFFAGTWIPDETFFQTLVRHLVPRDQIRSRAPTFLLFSDYGMPVTFHNDHHDLLLRQDAFFARKISPEARDLKKRLGDLYASGRRDFEVSGEGRRLHGYLTGRGRVGQRFAPRFWESAGLTPEMEICAVVCKKWHVAKRLTEVLRHRAGIPAIDYLFNEEEASLPPLGGLEHRLEKRTRHRRALVSTLFGALGSDRLVLCLDPAALDILQDLASSPGRLRVLHIACDISDGFLAGHARRAGLAGPATEIPPDLLAVLRRDIAGEAAALRAAGFDDFHELRQSAPASENALSLAAFLTISEEAAEDILTGAHLFDD